MENFRVQKAGGQNGTHKKVLKHCQMVEGKGKYQIIQSGRSTELFTTAEKQR